MFGAGGDRALFRYAAQFDGLQRAGRVAREPEEMAAAWDATEPALRKALVHCGIAGSRVRQAAVAEIVEQACGGRSRHRTACAPARFRWLLCAQRTPSAAVDAADDGDSRAGGGRGAHRGGLAEACAGDACRGAPAGHHASSTGSAERTRSPRLLTARRRIARVDKIVGPGNLYVTAAKGWWRSIARSTCSPARRRSLSPVIEAAPRHCR